MASDREYRVKRSIASSIGDIATIIGTEETENELFPIMEKLYREEGEIQTLILRNIPKILKIVSPEHRNNYLDRLQKIVNSREKWRTRQDYAKIVGEYNKVFDDDITYKHILPIALTFCLDDVLLVFKHRSLRSDSKLPSISLSSYSKCLTATIEIKRFISSRPSLTP
jgi:serine/threonine-protein phosphatase 4 regulatory subunit 1